MLVFLPTVAAAALTAAAAIAVGARRQLRELGLLAAVGADRRHLGQIVLLQGAGLGLVGGLAGIPLGLAVTWAAFPVMRTWLNPVVDEHGASIVPRFSVIGRDIRWVVAFTATVALLTSLRPAFAAAKAGLRSLAQSMARAYGPQGIHVAHVVVDGGIAGDKIIQGLPQFAQAMGEDGLVSLDGLADAYWFLYTQARAAWTHELDLRTYKESF